MALVAYDCSDDSDDNDDKESNNVVNSKIILSSHHVSNNVPSIPSSPSQSLTENATSTAFKLPQFKGSDNSGTHNNDDDDSDSDSNDEEPINISFSNLPTPHYHTLNLDESKIKLSKSGILKKLITSTSKPTKVPRVSCDKNMLQKSNESGLLSILPSPASESMNSIKSAVSNVKLLPTAVKNKIIQQAKIPPKEGITKEDDDDDADTDFLGLSEVDKIDERNILAANVNLPEMFELTNSYNSKPEIDNDNSKVSHRIADSSINNNPSVSATIIDEFNSNSDSESHLNLDEDAMLKLCGRKRKGQVPDDIQVIDIHEDNVLAETRKNLTKRLTEEVSYPSSKKFGGSSLQKRKHQITYLAYQAKERELELKNQWANNRFTRKQTQSKYGF